MTITSNSWLNVAETNRGRRYVVLQDTLRPRTLWLWTLGATVAQCILIAILVMDRKPQDVTLLIVPLGFLAFLSIGATIGATIGMLNVRFTRKPKAVFDVTDEDVYLIEKNGRKYPDKINKRDISHLYHGALGEQGHTNTNIYRSGSAESIVLSIAKLIAPYMDKGAYGVWANVRGDKIYLVKHISEGQAEYLFNELQSAILR